MVSLKVFNRANTALAAAATATTVILSQGPLRATEVKTTKPLGRALTEQVKPNNSPQANNKQFYESELYFRLGGRNLSIDERRGIYFRGTNTRVRFFINNEPFGFEGVIKVNGQPCPVIVRGQRRFVIIDNRLHNFVNNNTISRQPVTNVIIIVRPEENINNDNSCSVSCNPEYSNYNRETSLNHIRVSTPHQAVAALIRELQRRGYHIENSPEVFNRLIHFTPYNPVPVGGVVVIEEGNRVSIRGNFGSSNNMSDPLSELGGRSFSLSGPGTATILIVQDNALVGTIVLKAGPEYSRY
jgi:sulfite reductase alpha subunit-like flavoprotein